MNIEDMIESKYLKASDLKGKEPTVTIDRIEQEKMNDGKTKGVMYFVGKDKGVVLNVTNLRNIAYLYGSETDNWTGKQVTLYSAMVEFQGQTKAGIRVKGPAKIVPETRPDPISSGPQRSIPRVTNNSDMNDDIPF